MDSNTLKGKRFIALVRCSTLAQAGSSTDDQERIILRFAEAQGMTHVETIRLDGLSGSNWLNMDEVVERIIERKELRKDFDTVVVQDSSRLTRSGGDHGNYLRFMLRKVGIRVVNAANHIEDPRVETMVRTMEFEIASEQARANAYGIARGLRSSLESGRRTYANTPPYGVDRLILSDAGEELYRIRNKSDGSQVKVRPANEEEYEPLPPSKKGEPPKRHRKAKHERAALVPGEPARRDVVVRIYRRRLVDDWGAPAIARELNELGIQAPRSGRGSKWSATTIRQIVDNPAYSGLGVGFRVSNARLYRVGIGQPESVLSQPEDMTESNQARTIGRPEEVWVRVEEERLREYLPEDLRPLALEHHRQVLLRDAGGWAPAPRHDAHRGSDFVLKDLLRTSEGLPMTGTLSGTKSVFRRYRVHPRDAKRADVPRPAMRLAADEIEAEVLGAVQEIILADPGLEEQIVRAIEREQAELRIGEQNAAALEADHRGLLDEILFFSHRRPQLGDEVVEAAIAELRPRLEAATAGLAALSKAPRLSEAEVRARAAGIAADLRAGAALFEGASPGQVRALLMAMVADLSIDLETCEITMSLRAPDQALAAAMGPVATPLYRTCNWTHRPAAAIATIQRPWPEGPCCRRQGRKAA